MLSTYIYVDVKLSITVLYEISDEIEVMQKTKVTLVHINVNR